jgi:CHAT domain-containing protein
MRPLWNVQPEVDTINTISKRRKITADIRDTSDPPTAADVSDALESANFIHLACHGTQDATHPLSSGFCLSDRILTVEELTRRDLKGAFFAFLSACETAKGDKAQPDQTIHLAATLLFTGFKSVVATMWYVQLRLSFVINS